LDYFTCLASDYLEVCKAQLSASSCIIFYCLLRTHTVQDMGSSRALGATKPSLLSLYHQGVYNLMVLLTAVPVEYLTNRRYSILANEQMTDWMVF
jgi:hypothetical protein